MFTGIIQAVGVVLRVDGTPRPRPAGGAAHGLVIDLGALGDGLLVGASVAVNGACLTVAQVRGSIADFDVVPETWARTTLQELVPGEPVHLERSIRAGDPLDGHFVQGHVEGVGVAERVERNGGEWRLWTRTDPALLPAIVPKGSIALDGVSLTVVDADDTRFSVALVPTTLERTTLGRRRPGDRLNIETDILARLVLHRAAFLRQAAAEKQPVGLTWERLQEGGFVT